jgi:hypothetical protein
MGDIEPTRNLAPALQRVDRPIEEASGLPN